MGREGVFVSRSMQTFRWAPASWLEGRVSEHRRQPFDRVPYSADTENEDLPNNWGGWVVPPTHDVACL